MTPLSSRSAASIWTLASGSELVTGIVAAILVAASVALYIANPGRRDRRDSKIIYDFLLKSLTERNYPHRSTHAISVRTKMPEARVVELCNRHPHIKRGLCEKETWRVVPQSE